MDNLLINIAFKLTKLIFCLFMSTGFLMHPVNAKPIGKSADLAKDALHLTENNGALTLTVAQVSLPTVLKYIAEKHRFSLHLSDLPEQLVNANCTGADLPRVLICLLQNKADIVFRYQPSDANHQPKQTIAEAWVVPSTVNKPGMNTDETELPVPAPIEQTQTSSETATSTENRINKLLTQAQENNPQQKAMALGALLSTGRKDDPAIRDVLEQALTDPNPEVRVQALSTFTHCEGNDALAAIQQGLHDESADVRLIAVEGIKDDIALLQQMINDKNEAVQSLAEIKLQILAQRPSVEYIAQ